MFLLYLVAFFRQHGPKVKEIVVDPFGELEPTPPELFTLLETIIDLCPALQYLACGTWCGDEGLLDKLFSRSPPIQVDIWGYFYRIPVARSPDMPVKFPNVRLIDKSLVSLPDLPRFLLRPLQFENTHGTTVLHHAYHRHIIQTSFAIFQPYLWTDKNLLRWHIPFVDNAQRVTLKKWFSGFPELDSDQRADYAYVMEMEEIDEDSHEEDGSGESHSDQEGSDELEDTIDDIGGYEPPLEDSDGEGEDMDDEDDGSDVGAELLELTEEEALAAFSDRTSWDFGAIAYREYTP